MKHEPGTPWTRPAMLDLLDRSDVAVERALLVLYARQTDEEQDAGATTAHNGQGFGSFDAELLTSYARWIETSRRMQEGQRLTPAQMIVARKRVKKYVGQLVEVANQRLGVETPKEPRKRKVSP